MFLVVWPIYLTFFKNFFNRFIWVLRGTEPWYPIENWPKKRYANRACTDFNYRSIFISWILVSNGIRGILASWRFWFSQTKKSTTSVHHFYLHAHDWVSSVSQVAVCGESVGGGERWGGGRGAGAASPCAPPDASRRRRDADTTPVRPRASSASVVSRLLRIPPPLARVVPHHPVPRPFDLDLKTVLPPSSRQVKLRNRPNWFQGTAFYRVSCYSSLKKKNYWPLFQLFGTPRFGNGPHLILPSFTELFFNLDWNLFYRVSCYPILFLMNRPLFLSR